MESLISGVPDDDSRLDAPATCLTDLENIEAAMVKLLESIEVVENYVRKVAVSILMHYICSHTFVVTPVLIILHTFMYIVVFLVW